MKNWIWLLVGWLVGSFFGVQRLFSMFSGITGGAKAAPSTATAG